MMDFKVLKTGRIMISRIRLTLTLALMIPLVSSALLTSAALGEQWSVPVAGNAFRTAPLPGNASIQRGGGLAWSDTNEVYSIYFHIDRACEFELSLDASADSGPSTIQAKLGDQVPVQVRLENASSATLSLGEFKIVKPGYVKLDLQGLSKSGNHFAKIQALQVASTTPGLKLDFVRNNDGNMFYWGRRGPSVHLTYTLPKEVKLTYAYSELTIPSGQDTIGSYFMANGFAEGYFGIQVNGSSERRVLFSVWSPFETDDPSKIPQDQRIVALGKGSEVRLGEFGNEGSGGQSYLIYPWKADTTYRFLTEVKPDGQGQTTYTCWFGPKSEEKWKLVASFRRPKTNTYLRGLHSFLENFDPSFGHVSRSCMVGNVWVVDLESKWHECTSAKFSVDPTGGNRHRLDFAGGAVGDRFFLRNCGFFDENVQAGQSFDRKSSADQQPKIDLTTLPRK